MVIGIVFINCLTAKTLVQADNNQKSCPTDCQCTKEEVRCVSMRNNLISAMPKGIKTM